jgi:hypothetical protein
MAFTKCLNIHLYPIEVGIFFPYETTQYFYIFKVGLNSMHSFYFYP